jgi:prevent-host-death family protein
MNMSKKRKLTVRSSEFKARCLELVDRVRESGEPVTITRGGKPIARLVPVEEEEKHPSFGWLKGQIHILGDIISPIDVVWEAEQ